MQGKKWRTPERECQVIELYEIYHSVVKVAKIAGCGRSTVQSILVANDVPRDGRKSEYRQNPRRKAIRPKIKASHCRSKYCPVVMVLLHDMLGYTTRQIADTTGYNRNVVSNTLYRRGIPSNQKRIHANDFDLDQIKREYLAGATTYELGEKYGVHHATISRWMRKRGIRKGKGNKLSTSVVKTCPRCGKKFLTRYRDKTYCSKTCQNAVNWHKRNDVLRSSGDGDFITLREVYKRDKGRCYICGKKTDWNDFRVVNGYKVVGNLYPTREHVVALHNGGTHTWDNVRLACHGCNSAKGDKGQMRIAI